MVREKYIKAQDLQPKGVITILLSADKKSAAINTVKHSCSE